MFRTVSTLEAVLGGMDPAAFFETLWLLLGAMLGSAIALLLAYAFNLHERVKARRSDSRRLPPGDRRP